MEELDRLFPVAVEIDLAGRRFAVSPLAVRQFAPMMRAMQPVQHVFRLDTREVDLDALLASAAATEILAVALECEMDFLFSLDRGERLRAMATVLACNPDFFFPDLPPEADPESETDATVASRSLADAFQRLISAGHRWGDVQDYTLAQIALFDAAIVRLRCEGERTALLSARAAWGDAPVFKAMLKALGG